MNMLRLNPLRDFDSFFNAYNKMNSGLRANSGEWTPSVDVVEQDKQFVLKAELAGIPKEDIKVNIENNILTISGERKSEVEDKENHRIERFYGSFSRSFTLPENIDEEAIKAESKDGVLYLTLPKREVKEKLKQIEIH